LAERVRRVAATWPVVAIFLIVFVGMNGDFFFGRSLFTPTEGAAVGALLASIAALTVGGMRWRQLVGSVRATAEQSGMIFLILLGAELYNAFLARTNTPQAAAHWVAGLGISPYLVMAVIVLIYIGLGCLMDSLSMILLTIPIFFPVVMGLEFGLSPEHTAIWFGILALIVVELGLIHPPVGMNVFVIKSVIPEVSFSTIFAGVLPFIITDIVRLIILIAFPVLALWLPSHMFK
jgi:TRAP-type C4-dicarboxylate transport system permease large subunit